MKTKYEKPKITSKRIKLNEFLSSGRFFDSFDSLSSLGGLLSQGGCSGSNSTTNSTSFSGTTCDSLSA